MSDNNISPEFWGRAEEVIEVANEQLRGATIGKVSSSLLYAAARFNAFTVASSTDEIEEMLQAREEAIDYFTEQYRRMLVENLNEYIEIFRE